MSKIIGFVFDTFSDPAQKSIDFYVYLHVFCAISWFIIWGTFSAYFLK